MTTVPIISTRLRSLLVGLLSLSLLLSGGELSAQSKLTSERAAKIAEDAYIYGYPLVTMEMTRRVMTNVASPTGTRAPMGNLVRMRTYPNASFRDVTAPNADTLYTTAWIDVGDEPWILSLPEMHDRYFLMPMLDGWTNVFQVPGKRTTGTGPQKYAITSSTWSGKLPAGVVQYKSPTNIVWILGRIYCSGTPEDYAAVHKIQDEISLVPLSAYGKEFTPPAGQVDPSVEMKVAVREQVNALSVEQYFNLLAKLMVNNPPAAEDAPIVAEMAQLGIKAGQSFSLSNLDASLRESVQNANQTAIKKVMAHLPVVGKDENGWIFTTKTGIYGTDYLTRALITAIGLGANRPQDAVYPTSEGDAAKQSYDGSKSYVIHFEKGKLPPVNGFWSITMYNQDYFFVDNPLNRYTLSSRNKFKMNSDGSVDLYLQHQNPGGDKEANWLPAPAGKFILMLRMYWPTDKTPSIINGTWTIPAVQEVKSGN